MMFCINGELCMVILLVDLLVKMHVVESITSWCTGFDIVLVCYDPVVWTGSEYQVLCENH